MKGKDARIERTMHGVYKGKIRNGDAVVGMKLFLRSTVLRSPLHIVIHARTRHELGMQGCCREGGINRKQEDEFPQQGDCIKIKVKRAD